ncbi:hypothetical protein V9T40_001146 [Parthenolecanium corni]|uniref:Caspase-1 n=1 Tax=Parthenolecanium corni TaxID=536013 RepID=A0AAN9TAW3_9HEMI
MESNKNCIVEDVTGKTIHFHFPPGTDGIGDCVDALSQPQSPPKVEKSEVHVSQCKDDLFYNMNHPKRGISVIFNHEEFDESLDLEVRKGTKTDCTNLQETLQSMNFEVIVRNDLKFIELDTVLNEVAATDFSDSDCLLIFVLSHGVQNALYARDMFYSNNYLFDRFTPDKCPSLAGKPKIFIIQACQGKRLDPGLNVECDRLDAGVTSYRIPLYVDFLFAHSTIPGFYSWRNPVRGSFFIQAFCDELNRNWKQYDLVTILTFVNRRVACDFESYRPAEPPMHRQKQTSAFTSQLTRIIKFHPKTVENNDIQK